MSGVVPVFALNNQLPAFDKKPYTTAELCAAAEQCSGFETIEGAQKIGSLWRIYPRSAEARRKLMLEGFCLRGVQIEVKDKNPFLVISPDGQEAEIPATKLTINNIPMSFSDEEILKTVKKLGVSVRSKLIEERDRDKDGRLTRWKTGRRFLYIDIPKEPLPKSVDIGPFKAALYHKEQKSTTSFAECKKCLKKGHTSAQCPNPVKCRQCFENGHVAGDTECSLMPKNPQGTGSQEAESTSTRTAPRTPTKPDKAWNRHEDSTQQDRGRPAKRQRQAKKQGGQTVINFPKHGDRSASSKRPRSTETDLPASSEERQEEGTGSEQEREETADSVR